MRSSWRRKLRDRKSNGGEAWDLADDGEWTHRGVTEPEPRDVHRELMLGHSARTAEAATTA